MNFSVGDAHYYEGYYNAPLLYSTDYYIILRAVSQWREVRDIHWYVYKVKQTLCNGMDFW